MPDESSKKQIRNSTAEFLIFSAQSGGEGLEVLYEDGTIWLPQKLMASLFDVSVKTISEHLGNIFDSGELERDSVIRKFRTTAADGKSYLTKDELDSLGRIINAYLELAEERAHRRIPMTMEDWAKRLDAFLEFDEREILTNAGSISTKVAKNFAESEFEKFRPVQDLAYRSDFDREVKALKKKASDV
jgi:hypothetical protein